MYDNVSQDDDDRGRSRCLFTFRVISNCSQLVPVAGYASAFSDTPVRSVAQSPMTRIWTIIQLLLSYASRVLVAYESLQYQPIICL